MDSIFIFCYVPRQYLSFHTSIASYIVPNITSSYPYCFDFNILVIFFPFLIVLLEVPQFYPQLRGLPYIVINASYYKLVVFIIRRAFRRWQPTGYASGIHCTGSAGWSDWCIFIIGADFIDNDVVEIAYKRGFIDKEQLLKLAESLLKIN